MWISFAFLAAFLYGFYDSFKKASLRGNAVIPVLFLNTLFCAIILAPCIILSGNGTIADGSMFHVASGGWAEQKYIVLKSFIVLTSWILGYFAIKHLPLTIVGPVNATRPVMVLVGAILVFGERLNLWQWAGVVVAIIALWMLSRTGKKEGIDFGKNLWVLLLLASAIVGACSGLYDRYLMGPVEAGGLGLDRMMVLCWYNVYQAIIMLVMVMVLWYPRRGTGDRFEWRWAIPGISIFLCAADFFYMYALTDADAMVSVISMVKRGSVIVSFLFGAIVFHEKNLRGKAVDLILVFLSLVLLWIGSR